MVRPLDELTGGRLPPLPQLVEPRLPPGLVAVSLT